MSDTTPPTLDPRAAARWQRLPLAASPWLHEEVAQRMQERLDWIKARPAHWLHWAPLHGGVQAHARLLQRYPEATCTLLEATPERARQALRQLAPPWWKPARWRQPPQQALTQPQPDAAQMLWANMALHVAADPQALMAQWHQALAVDGFVMFSCLGPDTLQELRALYARLGWPAPAHAFTDMHDWGDMLVASGFAEPVMAMERITLSFETPERLLQELRGLGRNLHVARFAALRGKGWRRELLDALAQQPLQLSFEVIYGHAIKPAPRVAVAAHSEISLAQLRAALARKPAQPQTRGGDA